jgi:hypothetical protein
MLMQTPLSKKQVHEWMSLLTDEQQEFIERTIKQSKKSKWLEVLAKNKGISIKQDTTIEQLESLIDDWVLVEILDSGYGNRDYRCICGTPLRYQYIVFNKKNKQTYGLGETCFQNHTNLSVEVVKDIIKEFHKIDLTRDEILYMVATRQSFIIKPFLHLDNIPSAILEQADLKLPLTDKQKSLLNRLKEAHDRKVRTEELLRSLEPKAREILESFPEKIKQELIWKIGEGDYYRALPDGFDDKDIELFLSLGLPLLDKQIKRIHVYNSNVKREKEAQRKKEEAEYWSSIRKQQNSIPKQEMTNTSSLDFETINKRHIDTLEQVYKREHELSRGMKESWLKIQSQLEQSLNGEEIDYSSFKLNLCMICYALKIKLDNYL